MQKHDTYGFLRLGVSVPRVKVADCNYNTQRIIEQMSLAQKVDVSVLVFPELCLTAYTCADLFQHKALQNAALESLSKVVRASLESYHGLVFVGLPIVADDQLFNCAAAIQQGRILGIVPKSYIPNYKEFYERRWFSPATNATINTINILGQTVSFGADLLFAASDNNDLIVGAEICEDLWAPIPPSSYQALAGATVLVNLSASNELIGKAEYRRELVVNQSGRCMAAYAYSSCGTGESSTDLVFSGHCIIAENGHTLSENRRFETEGLLHYADIDLDRLSLDRTRTNTFADNKRVALSNHIFRKIEFVAGQKRAPEELGREIEAHPFVPRGQYKLEERCHEIFQIQVAALSKRIMHLGSALKNSKTTIGVSGGLDSTLALLVLCKAMDSLEIPRSNIIAFTMPGFGTTNRTKTNALALMKKLGVQSNDLDIKSLCFEELKLLKHKPFNLEIDSLSLSEFCEELSNLPAGSNDLVFENVQARMRTSILMNAGFCVGTGDLSELALGWCTYNADHMSMYNPNASIPKTLVKFLVSWASSNEFDTDTRAILEDVVATEISPELLPAGKDGKITQKTESTVGPYELNDFFLFYILRFASTPEKILYLAKQAKFDNEYSPAEIEQWLKLFIRRFFNSQFKRSCLPDGPKVGSVSLSPRGDWRMPTDAQASVWLEWADKNQESKSTQFNADPNPIKLK